MAHAQGRFVVFHDEKADHVHEHVHDNANVNIGDHVLMDVNADNFRTLPIPFTRVSSALSVFMAYKKGSGPLEVSIWTAPVAGGEAKRITQNASPAQDRYPCWSPDGKSVAFLRYEPGAAPIPQVLVTSSNGGAPRQITSEQNKVDLGSIDWSPDGKTIAYSSRDHTINLIPAEGGEPRVLLDVGSSGHNWYSDLAWSPDGSELAYTSSGRLMVLSQKSGQTREVQTGVLEKGVSDFYIDWSPDGSKLAFSVGLGGDEELWLMEDFLHLVKNKK